MNDSRIILFSFVFLALAAVCSYFEGNSLPSDDFLGYATILFAGMAVLMMVCGFAIAGHDALFKSDENPQGFEVVLKDDKQEQKE